MIVERANLLGDGRSLLEQQRPRQQQVVVVQQIALGFAPHIVAEEPLDVAGPGEEVGPLLAQQFCDGTLGVDVPRVDGLQRFGTGEAWGRPGGVLEIGVAEGGAGNAHQIGGIGLIEDREVGGEAGGGPEPAQQAVGDAMEGAAVHLMRGGADQPLTASQHFLGGAAGEGEE